MSSMVFRNETLYVAQFVLRQGQRIIARLPGLVPDSQVSVPTGETYTVEATTIIDGNTYSSAPLNVSGPQGFVAQVTLDVSSGSYVFDVMEVPATAPGQLQFQSTCSAPVTFTVKSASGGSQAVVVADDFTMHSINTVEPYSIYAIVNGITTDVAVTTDPDATVTVVADDGDLEDGYYTLVIS